ncbi:MAG: hypothetical protein ACKVOH_04575 [Chlamydiales bacterium]
MCQRIFESVKPHVPAVITTVALACLLTTLVLGILTIKGELGPKALAGFAVAEVSAAFVALIIKAAMAPAPRS